jgi:hypothetical protein
MIEELGNVKAQQIGVSALRSGTPMPVSSRLGYIVGISIPRNCGPLQFDLTYVSPTTNEPHIAPTRTAVFANHISHGQGLGRPGVRHHANKQHGTAKYFGRFVELPLCRIGTIFHYGPTVVKKPPNHAVIVRHMQARLGVESGIHVVRPGHRVVRQYDHGRIVAKVNLLGRLAFDHGRLHVLYHVRVSHVPTGQGLGDLLRIGIAEKQNDLVRGNAVGASTPGVAVLTDVRGKGTKGCPKGIIVGTSAVKADIQGLLTIIIGQYLRGLTKGLHPVDLTVGPIAHFDTSLAFRRFSASCLPRHSASIGTAAVSAVDIELKLDEEKGGQYHERQKALQTLRHGCCCRRSKGAG